MPQTIEKSTFLAISTCLALQIFIFVPATVYFSNFDEMNIALTTLIQFCLIPVLSFVLICFFLGAIIPNRYKLRLTILFAMISILVWFQSHVLLWDYGLLNGTTIDWSKNSWRGWVDIVFWILGISVILLWGMAWEYSFHQKIIRAALLLVIIQTLTIGVLLFQHRETLITQNDQDSNADLRQMYQFSRSTNIVHIILDGFQSDIFQDLIENPNVGKFYQEKFSGFVFYQETLGAFPYTRFAVPAFLAGKMYANDMPQDDFVDSILSGKNIFNLATAKGYELDLGVPSPYLEKRYGLAKHTNLYNFDSINSTQEETFKILDLSLFRMTPHFIKPFIYNHQKWLLTPYFLGNTGMQFHYFKHTYFLNNLISHMNVSRDKPVYKYLHLLNTHMPMVVDGYCRFSGHVLAQDRESLTVQAKCTLDNLVRLFEKMQQLGIYDNALIVIHGDHGAFVPNHRGVPLEYPEGQIAPEWVAALASPMLSIKLPQASGQITYSTKLVSLMDIPDTISDIMQWQETFGQKSILQIPNNSERERHFRFYGWEDKKWSAEYTWPIQEFIIKGSHYENKWILGRLFPPFKEAKNKTPRNDSDML